MVPQGLISTNRKTAFAVKWSIPEQLEAPPTQTKTFLPSHANMHVTLLLCSALVHVYQAHKSNIVLYM